MGQLKDPGQTRIVKQLKLPYQISLTRSELFDGHKVKDQVLTDFIDREGRLDPKLVIEIIKKGKVLLEMEPNLLMIRDPVTIIGDIHGQYYDFRNILEKIPNMGSSKNRILFLGDYVDRGNFSIGVMLKILALKINYPKYVFLLRGNHECKQLTNYFNFRSQCLSTYSQDIYEEFMELFNMLPLAALVNGSMLCVHGGISTNLANVGFCFMKLQDIMKLNRFQEVPKSGLFCDLLWADPIDHIFGHLDNLTVFNEDRGCSYHFGWEMAKMVIAKNKLKCIIRAHEAKQQGFEMHQWAGIQNFPPVITVFSAPNYCDFYQNKAAIIYINKNELQISQFTAVEHPFYLPGDQTIFEWSIPFLSEKTSQMLYCLLNGAILQPSEVNKEQILDEATQKEIDENNEINIMIIDRAKVIETLLDLQSQQVQDNLEIIKLFSLGKTLGEQLIYNKQVRQYCSDSNSTFEQQKKIDKINQRRPQAQMRE